VFVRRSSWHSAPVIELPMLRVHDFAVGNAAAVVFFAGFGAMLLASVLLLQQLWGYSVLHAGVALIPGPLMAALFAAPAGRLGGRFGQKPVVAAGGIAIAISFIWPLAFVDTTPNYVGAFLPGFLVGGIGVGLVLGALPGAVTASLPPERFATGTAVYGMARQVGAAIGVAILVALLADPAPADLLPALQRGWVFMLGTGVAVFTLALSLRPSPAPAAQPAEAPA
jgi:MFS family permease